MVLIGQITVFVGEYDDSLGADVAGVAGVLTLQHSHLGIHTGAGLHGHKEGVLVILDGKCQVILVADALQFFLQNIVLIDFTHCLLPP